MQRVQILASTDHQYPQVDRQCASIASWVMLHPEGVVMLADILLKQTSLENLNRFQWTLANEVYSLSIEAVEELKSMLFRLFKDNAEIDIGKRRGLLMERISVDILRQYYRKDVSFVMKAGCPIEISKQRISWTSTDPHVNTVDIAWKNKIECGFHEMKIHPDRFENSHFMYMKLLADTLSMLKPPVCHQISGICAQAPVRLLQKYIDATGDERGHVVFLGIEQWAEKWRNKT